ncbi:uncharacterized protein JCM15063_000643 [Sporobolomyces koalae]|uniref:uncharacterized protein n=1 Tax=Sporobolomyces koalae TaxID=500713 RepID=UPI00317759C0
MSISTREAKQSYHPKGYGVSEGLKRARAPFRTRNAIVGLALSGFMFSVYLYSIRAVAQDDFADLEAPTEEQRRNLVSIEEEKRNREALKGEQLQIGVPSSPLAPAPPALPTTTSKVQTGGVLARLRGAFGGKGTESKLVWGAPSVDRVGRIGEDLSKEQIQRRIV